MLFGGTGVVFHDQLFALSRYTVVLVLASRVAATAANS